MNKTAGRLLAAALGAGAIVGYAVWQKTQPPPTPSITEPEALPAASAPAPAAAVPPAIQYPVPPPATPQAQAALPELPASDASVLAALGVLLGEGPVQALFYPEEVVRRIVVTVDNLPRETAAARLLPLKPADGTLQTEGATEALTIAPQNAARYQPIIKLAEATDTSQAVALYLRFYPLFQRAYQDLGYPDGYFNDRLVAVIDHLLATPESNPRALLVQPHVLYRYADPQLEAASAGQKIMWRLGRANAARVKVKLRQFRAALIAQSAQQPAPSPKLHRQIA